MKNQWARRSAIKRGGAVERIALQPRSLLEEISDSKQLSPEDAFDRQWAIALLNRVLTLLRQDYQRRNRGEIFDLLKDAIVPSHSQQSYQRIAAELGSSEGAVKALVFRMRRKFRLLLELEVSQTVSDLDHLDDEIQVLFEAFSRS